MAYKDIENFIKGKTVAIVGNSQMLLKQEYGDIIDAHDVVIRMNYGYTRIKGKWVNPKSIGKKTDIVACGNAVNILPHIVNYPHLHHIVHLSTQNRNKTVEKYSELFEYYPKELWDNLKKVLTKRPSSGMMVFDMVENCNPRHVNIFGFDWKQTRTYYNDGLDGRLLENPSNPIGPHNWEGEKKYIMDKLNKLGNWDIL